MPSITWHQADIATHPDADKVAGMQTLATYVAPELDRLTRLGTAAGWWYIRKIEIRVRIRTDDAGFTSLGDYLDKLTVNGHVAGWHPNVYEPETTAFGGPVGLDHAHQLFHADSHHLCSRVRAQVDTTPPLGPRETMAILCAVLLRAAGLDRYEQADVWEQVAAERPVHLAHPVVFDEQRRELLTRAMDQLLTVNPFSLADAGGPLAGQRDWMTAFETLGQALLTLAQTGRLRRGLRAVLAHHVIFHANRAGISVPDLSTLAALAMAGTFGFGAVVSAPSAPSPTSKVPAVTTVSDQASTPDQLRSALADRLTQEQIIVSPAVREAIRTVPRHLFIPHVPLQTAYADEPVYTKTAGDGARISAASQPRIVAMMLEQLDLRPGHRVLEAGAGTGYNAALMAALVGGTGHVTTIDVDTDLVNDAVAHLAAAGVTNVDVRLADGALGHPGGAPYDRIIATVGAYDVPVPWLDQLITDGRLVVPLRLRGAASRSITFVRNASGWRSANSELAVFMPLRGIGDDARRIVAINKEQDVTLQVNKDQTVERAELDGILDTPAHTVWTGVVFPPMVPYEWIDLWLALRLPNSIMRMNAAPAAVERGQVKPMFGWGAMATVEGPTLAYLTLRPVEPVNGQKQYEIGVTGHGPDAAGLAERITVEATTWNARFRHRAVHFELPTTSPTADPDEGRFVLNRSHHPIVVIWE